MHFMQKPNAISVISFKRPRYSFTKNIYYRKIRQKVNLIFYDMSIQQPMELKVEYFFRTLSFTSLMADLHQDNLEGALMEYYLEGIALFKILLHYVTQMRRVTKINKLF